MKKTLLTLGTIFTMAQAGSCVLVQDNNMSVSWDAFKTDSKISVHGKFIDVKYTPKALEGKNFREILVGSKVTIDGSKIDTAIASRDDTIVDFFFNKLSTVTIEGTITDIKADDYVKGKPRVGIVTIDITLNGKTKSVDMNYNYFKEDFSATGSIELADFAGLDALASVDTHCHDLYKGKIWSDVTIKFNTKIQATLCNVDKK